MPARKLEEWNERFPVGTEVIYTPPLGVMKVRSRIAQPAYLFKQTLDTCVVLLENGMLVPCDQLVLADTAPAD